MHSKFYNYNSQVERYLRFFKNIDKHKKILDFGAGPGWSLFVGRYLGYDIVGLDVEDKLWTAGGTEMGILRKYLKTDEHTVLYASNEIPFEDKNFDIIICKASLDKGYLKDQNKEIELNRILKDDGIIYYAPPEHNRFLRNIKSENKKVLNITSENVDVDNYKELFKIAKVCVEEFLRLEI